MQFLGPPWKKQLPPPWFPGFKKFFLQLLLEIDFFKNQNKPPGVKNLGEKFLGFPNTQRKE